MTKTMQVIASMVAVVSAGSARAELIAGWDFSQYFTAGRLTIDGTTYVDTLDANYSSLDPSFNAGAGAAAYGTLYMDGTFGSTGIDPTPGNASVIPAPRKVGDYGDEAATAAFQDIPVGDGAVSSNVLAPVSGPGTNPFNAFSILRAEGQTNTELLALQALGATTIAFEADSLGATDLAWEVSFGGRSMAYETSVNVGVAFAPNCGAYGATTNVVLSEEDDVHTVSFAGGGVGTSGCVRMDLDPDAVIDNVAVVPEPGFALGLGAGVLTLMGLARRRA